MRTRLSLLLTLAATLPSAASAQAPALTQVTDPRGLLLRVRDNVTNTLARLPRYLCTLTIDRAQYSPVKGRRPSCDSTAAGQLIGPTGPLSVTDRLRLDVAIATSNEIYSWVGEDRFDNPNVFELVKDGALQTGNYSIFLGAIFRYDVASFSYSGETTLDGRELAEFAFEVPPERSSYLFGNRREDSVVGYGGAFLVDPKTADLVRLDIRVNSLPEESGACRAATILDYTRERLNDSDFLLPSQTQLYILNLDGVEMRNHTVYSGCHEFVGESVLKFGDENADSAAAPGAPTASGSSAPLPQSIPAGATFQIRFSQAIDTKTAAAGDRIQATLTTPIKDPSAKAILIREGAAIGARIVKLQHFYGPAPSVRVLVKLETISSGGISRPLIASFSAPAQRRPNAGVNKTSTPLGSFDVIADPGVGAFEVRNADAAFVIKSGLESAWTASADSGDAVHP